MKDYKEIWLLVIAVIVLFFAWIATGGPERAKESGDAYNKFQKPLAPLDSGKTFNQSLIPKDIKISF